MFKRFIASLVCFTFIFSNFQQSQAQPASPVSGDSSINQLPVPGTMIFTTPAYVPLTLKGLIVHPENALKFDFLMDTGNSRLKGSDLSDEALKIMKYFLTALTIPEDDLWVNLSPYEKGRIIQDNFGQTIMGRDLLAQDYILKQLTASLIYPEKALGKEFWQQVYSKAAKEYGTTQIPVNTFNKVWIVPSEAVVWEHEGKVLIVKSRLKVMLEEDYLALSKHQSQPGSNGKASQGNNLNASPTTSTLASRIVRAIVLPVLEKEVNEGKNFAQLRQMYQAMILATWYKKALKESILNKVYADKKKVAGIGYTNSTDIESIYQQYLKAFKKGAFNYIKEDVDSSTGQAVPRKYFSGGFGFRTLATVLLILGSTISFGEEQAATRVAGQAIVVMENTVAQAQTNKKPIHPQVKSKTKTPIPVFKLIPEKEVIETIEKANGQKNLTADPNFLYSSWALINNDKVFAFLRSHFASHRTDRKNSMPFDRGITDFFLNPDHANLDEARCLLIFVQIEGYKKDRIPLPDKDFLDREILKVWNEAVKRHLDGKDQSMLSPSAQETSDAAMQGKADILVTIKKGYQLATPHEKLIILRDALKMKQNHVVRWAVDGLRQTGSVEAIEPLLEGLKGKYGLLVMLMAKPALIALNVSIETRAGIEDKEKMFHIYVTALRSNDVNAEVIEAALEVVDNLANKVSKSVRDTAIEPLKGLSKYPNRDIKSAAGKILKQLVSSKQLQTPGQTDDVAMLGFLSDWRKKNEALVKKHFSKMGVQDTLSELDKPGYAEPFYAAGSERINQLLKNGAVIKREKNKELVMQYFRNSIVLPAKYKNDPDTVLRSIIEVIFTKLKDPEISGFF